MVAVPRLYHGLPASSTPHQSSLGHPRLHHYPLSHRDLWDWENAFSYTIKKRLSGQGKKLSKEMFYRLVDFFNVYPPTDCLQRHHCNVITTYQNQRERTKFIHVLKV
jgi:hypothetical protein